ncbi:NEDD4-binding protein 2 isoform X2 [Hoplias malabaricus]|uniref:NEDD4-binding protein 2 isoform X2 n=1 Tax=Hoplias malabaricus TaxID=27720 RepID=UPI0034631A79
MPKKKRNGQSPGRVSAQFGGDPEGRGPAGKRVPRNHQRNSQTTPTCNSQSRDQIVMGMQEMFSHLDPDVIHMVLSEADFKVENAMDALLELSDAAEGKTSATPPLSGFEIAAALLDTRPTQIQTEPFEMTSEISAVSESIDSCQRFSPETAHLTKEFDSLIDQELETLTLQESHPDVQLLPSSIPLASLPPPSQSVAISSFPPQSTFPGHQAMSEFDQLDVENDSKFGSLSGQSSDSNPTLQPHGGAYGGASPVNELSFGGASCPQEMDVSVDFSHLTEDSSSRFSAFKAYCRTDYSTNQVDKTLHSKGLQTASKFWDVQAPEFNPHPERPVFITPVMDAPNSWNAHPFTAAQWLARRPVSQAPLKPLATVPKSWTVPPQSRLKLSGQVLVLLRGAPGSGKTTLASAMLEQNPSGVVLSTDEYFIQNGTYVYERDLLGEAHAWNHQRAKEAFEEGYTPIIIDNTNMQCWEMKPYVALALKHKYGVLFREPDTWWKTKPRELEKRTKHGVTREKIRRMLEHQDRYVTVQKIMDSQSKSTAVFGVDIKDPRQQTSPIALSRPDLVDYSGFSKSAGHLSSSLPDVSSLSSHNSAGMGTAEDETGSDNSKEHVLEQIGTTDIELLDGMGLDLNLDTCSTDPLSKSSNHNVNEDFAILDKKTAEKPVLFSETIGQRVRRERECSRFANDAISQPLNTETNDSSVRKAGQVGGAEEDDKPELLNFVGDWPSEILGQRGKRSQKSTTDSSKSHIKELQGLDDDNIPYNRLLGQSECDSLNKTEFQKILDFSQGVGSHICQEGTEQSPSLSVNEQNLMLKIKDQILLPDCAHEWMFGTSDPADDLQCQRSLKEQKANKDLQVIWKQCLTPDVTINQGGEVDHNLDINQEKRKGPCRRATKSCRLALTFTNKSASSASLQSWSPVASPQATTCLCASVQTDPKDFSLVWRINFQKCSEAESNSLRDLVILEGNPMRFVPKTNKETSSEQQGVPYRVSHEKGSQVEEGDLSELPLKQHSLGILSLHFKHIPMETLEDLYEKCNQDMDWTTNLLLDSGEHFYREEDVGKNVGSPGDTEGDLGQVSKEEPSCQVTGQLPELKEESQLEVMVKNVCSKYSDVQSVVPGTSENCSSSLSIDAGQCEDRANQSSLIHVSKTGDQKNNLENKFVERDQGGTVEIIDPNNMSIPSNNKRPNQHASECRTQKDPVLPKFTESETETQKELTSVSQKEMFDQYFDEGWIEEEARQCDDEDREIKREIDAVTQSLLAQLEDMELKKAEENKERRGQGKNRPLDIKMLELKLPTELALQLTELFGPVGISPGEFAPEDCSVLMDLNLAKLLHHKWKETIQERHRQAALSYHLLQQSSVHWGESEPDVVGKGDSAAHFLIGADGYSSLSSQGGFQENFPFMDHWNVSHPPVSLRNIMMEEQVMQDSLEKSKQSRWDIDKKDGAAILKEKQLFALFPTIDRHFLRDIFRTHNYSLEQTEQFLHTLLDDGPVKNVVAPGVEYNEMHRATSKERKRKQKNEEPEIAQFQDTEDPEYEDFRTEAMLQRRRQQECFDRAAEAYRQGRKDVASFYAQQGHLHGQKMREANHRAAVQIFERVNATLLPQNVLDLHGLHVDEALHHLQQVLLDKTSERQQGLCRPQLSVITGRGNHSQGGVPRIRPAVLDYLKSQHYRYSEPKAGLILVTLH